MKKKILVSIATCALVLTAIVAVKPALAYFTDYSVASGSVPVTIKDTPTGVDESFDSWTKHVVITNAEDGYECFVRVAAMAGDKYKIEMGKGTEKGWEYNSEDGYYYYYKPLAPGGSTSNLDLVIEGAEDDDFNVIIVHEATKVLYDGDGNPYADWSTIINSKEEP